MENIEQKRYNRERICQKLNESQLGIMNTIATDVKHRAIKIVSIQTEPTVQRVQNKLLDEATNNTNKSLNNYFNTADWFKSAVSMEKLKRNAPFEDYLLYYELQEEIVPFIKHYAEVVEKLDITSLIEAEKKRKEVSKDIFKEIASLYTRTMNQEVVSSWLEKKFLLLFSTHELGKNGFQSKKNLDYYTKEDFAIVDEFFLSSFTKNKRMDRMLHRFVKEQVRESLFRNNTISNTQKMERELRKNHAITAKGIIKKYVESSKCDVEKLVEQFFQTHHAKPFDVFIDELFTKYPEAEKKYKQTRLARLFR